MKKCFKLLSAALLALGVFVPAMATELTVFDGTDENQYAPVYGYYYDSPGSGAQTIYPEAELSAMAGSMINSVKFYVADQGGNNLSGGLLSVSIGTTTQTEFSGFEPSMITGLTHVADITMTAGETEVVVVFDEPFEYPGGNLVIETIVKEKGEWAYAYFYGMNAPVNNAMYKGTYMSYANAFYPKATFEYSTPENLAVLSPRVADFGMVYLGKDASQTLTLKNMGVNAFTPVIGTLQAPFSLEATPVQLQPGESMEITVNFVPTEAGEFAQTLTIDCGEAGQFEVNVTGASAEEPLEIVVCDGDDMSAYQPVYGYYYDMANDKAQMIYTDDMLAELVGKTITNVTFHPTAPLDFYDGVIQLSFKSVEQDEFSNYEALSDFTAVATLTPSKGDTELTFVLDEPYEYNGGNLAIETLNIEVGYYANASFYGVATEGYSSFNRYGNGYTDMSKFLPKVTFTYQKEEAPEFEPGDVNHDGQITIADVTELIDYLLADASAAPAEADVNGDNSVTIADVTELIDILLSGV